jgi:hypothetical protein
VVKLLEDDKQFQNLETLLVKVNDVKNDLTKLDSTLKPSLDTINQLINSTRLNTISLQRLDTLTNISISTREEALKGFDNASKDLMNLSKDISTSVKRNTIYSEFLINNEIGGNSFAVVRPFNRSNYDFYLDSQIQLEIMNVGPIGLKNVSVTVENLTARKMCMHDVDWSKPNQGEMNLECMEKYTQIVDIGDLYITDELKFFTSKDSIFGNQGLSYAYNRIIATIPILPEQRNLSLRITVESNNGQTMQLLDFLNIQNASTDNFCTQPVRKGPEPKSLYFQKQKNYPQKAFEKFFYFDQQSVIDPKTDYFKLN